MVEYVELGIDKMITSGPGFFPARSLLEQKTIILSAFVECTDFWLFGVFLHHFQVFSPFGILCWRRFQVFQVVIF